jgi:hypothetical protein
MSANHRSHVKNSARQHRPVRKVKWWQRPITWIAGVISVLILAVATALGTGIGNSIFNAAKGHPSTIGPPVAIEAISIQPWQDYSFVIPRKLVLAHAQLITMNKQGTASPSAYASWFDSHGGVIANRGIIGITVRGNGTGPVTITDMQVVKHCGRPLAGGTLFYSPTTGAGPFSTDQIGFDLSQQLTIGQYLPAPGPRTLSPGGNFFAKKVITLKPGEPQTLSAYVTAQNEYCSFTFQLHVATPDGRPVTETITDNGKPFQITTDGETGPVGTVNHVPFSSYRVVYAGGAADPQNQQAFVQVNPASYRGTGNPDSFPPGSAVSPQAGPPLGQLAGIYSHGVGFGTVKPSEIFNGGDPTGLISQITWQSWGAPEAIGIGTAEYVKPTQTVASGKEEPATVIAFKLGSCNGKLMYRAVEWYFPQHGQSFNPKQYEDICAGS